MRSILPIILCIWPSLACKCRLSPFNEYICSAEFAIKAKIISKADASQNSSQPTIFRRVEYTLKVEKEYKASENYESLRIAEGSEGKVKTSATGASCGVALDIGQVYLLTGYVSDGSVWVHSCTLNKLWDSLSEEEKLSLEQGIHCNSHTTDSPL